MLAKHLLTNQNENNYHSGYVRIKIKHRKNLIFSGLVALTGLGVFANAGQAVTPNDIETVASSKSMGQVNSVFQLRDVAPSDWAFDALRNLVEKYNCIIGYPDGTFRGNRPLSRYEFAAGLNACLQQIERLITGGSDVDATDITRLRALVQEFEAELATLGVRVDDIEGRVEFLEDNQFSTTTKLEGKVIFAAIAATGGEADDDQITFGNRVRLNLDTSFTGQDNLRVRLLAENLNSPDIDTNEGTLGFAGDNGNDVEVDALVYAFPIGEKLEVAIAANAGASDDFASTINPLDGDGNEGSITAFGTRNPIYYQIEDKGLGLNYAFSDKVNLGLGYMAPDANDPSENEILSSRLFRNFLALL